MMTSRGFSICGWLFSLFLLMTGAACLYFSPSAEAQSNQTALPPAGSARPAAADVRGTWSGTFFPKHSNVAPFTMTVVINSDANGHLVGNSTLNSDCLKEARLEVMVTGVNVEMSGSDESG